MELYSGRLDIIKSHKETRQDINQFFKSYASPEMHQISCFEDKTKAGLPTKEHIHFLFYSTHSHDGMRRTLSGLGYKGPLASLSLVSKNVKYTQEGTYSYVMKQGQTFVTNVKPKELKQLYESAKKVNDEIKLSNSFQDHWTTTIMPGLIEKKVTSRPIIIKTIHQYITEYNLNEPNDSKRLNYPQRTHILNILHKYEAVQLSSEDAVKRYMADLSIRDIYDDDIVNY